MTNSSPILRGRFRFLRPSSDDLERLFPESGRVLPIPHPLYPTDEASTPILGFPILVDTLADQLRTAAHTYIQEAEKEQIARLLGQPLDRRHVEQAWKQYCELLEPITLHAVASSFGRQYLAIFWLFHSIAVARAFKESPRRCRSLSPELTPPQAAEIKYRVFRRFVDGVSALTRRQTEVVGRRFEQAAEDLYPELLTRMQQNVLILTEDHIGSDLKEIELFLDGYLGIEGRSFRERLKRLKGWHRDRFDSSRSLRRISRHLIPVGEAPEADELLLHPGYVPYLTTLDGYDSSTLFAPEDVENWSGLLERLKEFEILLAWRRLVTPVRRERDRLRFAGGSASQRGSSDAGGHLAESTRALDFGTPSVIDPIVRRFGLVYDMTRFSEIVSVLQRTGSDTEDDSFRSIFEFQRWANRIARERRVTLEKYLGDGALYSARAAEPLLAVAIRLQRRYAALVESGFPLDRGMRMAMNFGAYRLIPLDSGDGATGQRFEFLGHGINELSRLVTGKSVREVEEIKAFLIGRGYARSEVDGFFAPLMHREARERRQTEAEGPFSAQIDRNGALVNEGIVVTAEFLTRLQTPSEISRVQAGGFGWTSIALVDGGEELRLGVRKLGRARFKGLEDQEVFSICDGAGWSDPIHEPLDGSRPLLSIVRSDYRQQSTKSQ